MGLATSQTFAEDTYVAFGVREGEARVPIDGVYVINLASMPDRWLRAQRAFQEVGIEPKRIDAVDLRKDPSQAHEYLSEEAMQQLQHFKVTGGRRKCADFGSPGMVGCFMSHLKAYRQIINDQCRNALILEDDFIWNKEAFLNMSKYLQRVPLDFDIFNLGVFNRDLPHQASVDGIQRVHHFFQLHAYIVSATGAEKLQRLLLPMRKQIDCQIGDLNEQGELITYATTFPLIWQRGILTTTIQSMPTHPLDDMYIPLQFGYERTT